MCHVRDTLVGVNQPHVGHSLLGSIIAIAHLYFMVSDVPPCWLGIQNLLPLVALAHD